MLLTLLLQHRVPADGPAKTDTFPHLGQPSLTKKKLRRYVLWNMGKRDMIGAHLEQPVDTIDPQQLAMLQRVFDHVCARSGIAKNTPQAEGLAATLMHLFQQGTTGEARLAEMLSEIDFI
ncbi:hypothetical protein [Rhizobium halophilum]|uniref:hypothetical protein n=1 Tax=Rhizobium halophilum TaxID=2846852 RepID=UPI001EFEB669|nr:hypothetical protein [Rhizobium halophilum]MCF6370135.1 hypothetical protein [Rhizobium halophilum]